MFTVHITVGSTLMTKTTAIIKISVGYIFATSRTIPIDATYPPIIKMQRREQIIRLTDSRLPGVSELPRAQTVLLAEIGMS